jgi:hypothetical protein
LAGEDLLCASSNVGFAQYQDRLYVVSRDAIGIIDLIRHEWVQWIPKPDDWCRDLVRKPIVVGEVNGAVNIFSLCLGTPWLFRYDSNGVGQEKIVNPSGKQLVALEFFDHMLTVVDQDGVMNKGKPQQNGQIAWEAIQLPINDHLKKPIKRLDAIDYMISNGRVVLIEFGTCLHVFNAADGTFKETIDCPIEWNGQDDEILIDGDQLIVMSPDEEDGSIHTFCLNLVTKKMYTRPPEDSTLFRNVINPLIYYRENKGRLVFSTWSGSLMEGNYKDYIRIVESVPQ